MLKPKFEVGEKAILYSTKYPQYNGVVNIFQVFTTPTHVVCRATGCKALISCSTARGTPVVSYLVDPIGVDGDGYELVWAEDVLRKIDPPAELSFSSLMSSLNQTQEVGV